MIEINDNQIVHFKKKKSLMKITIFLLFLSVRL